MKIFTNSLEGRFISRPNRFMVKVSCSKNIITAHCPNPGRLKEILLPGTKLILEKSSNKNRKLPYSLVAAYYKKSIRLLYSLRANRIAEKYLKNIFVDSVIKSEVKYGNSRFDFHVSRQNDEYYIEVKACTLIENRLAMFPDAPSDRAKRHIQELAEIKKVHNIKVMILFIIMDPNAEIFTPNFHTDPDFSRTLYSLRKDLLIKAASFKINTQGTCELVNPDIKIELEPVKLLDKNKGSVLFFFYLEDGSCRISHYFGTNLAENIKQTKYGKSIIPEINELKNKAVKFENFPVYTDKNIENEINIILRTTSDKTENNIYFYNNNPFFNVDFNSKLFSIRHRT